MIRVPAPADVNGDALREELAAAGIPGAVVTRVGDELEIGADEAHRATVEQVVADHVPPPPPVDPSEDLAARLEALAAKQSPTVKEVIAALLGTDPSAAGAVAGRPT